MSDIRVAIVGGSQVMARTALWRACRDLGADIHMVGVGNSGRSPPPLFEGANLRPSEPFLLRGRRIWWWYPGLAREVRRLRPDILHVLTEPWSLSVLQSHVAVRRLGVPVCAHGADNLYLHGPRAERAVRRAVLRYTLPRLGGFASWNSEGVRLARAFGLRASAPVVVVPAGTPDPLLFRPPRAGERSAIRRRLGLPVDRVVLGFVGRLVPEKGIGDLLASVASLGYSRPFLAVWGDGTMHEEVAAGLGDGSGMGMLGGWLAFDRVPEAMRACDILVVPSKTTADWAEQFGRVAVEAMLSGCAVVAYRSGALPDVVGGAGILVEEGDVDGLARAVADLVANDHARAAVAGRGRRLAQERFAPHALARRMVRFWTDVVGRS